MKITCIKTHHVRSELDKPFGFSQWSYSERNVLLVEVITDSGLSGWGECYGPAAVIQACVEKFYAPRLINEDAIATERLWHFMWRSSLDFARSGVMMAGMSGIDMALWDLKGKALGLSVSELMGGRSRAKVPCYATGMYFQDMAEESLIATLVEEALTHAASGFKAMKIKIGKNVAFDKKLIVAMRQAMPDMVLAADSNHAYDLQEAAYIAKVLEDNCYEWFEEPLSPEHPNLFKQLQAQTRVAIATGECEQTRYGFNQLIRQGGVQLVQADLAYCGGPSEAIKIRNLASANGINMIPHVWGTQLNLAAATHFLATSYSEPGRGEAKPLLLEYDRTENPLRDELFKVNVEVHQGEANVPTEAGLGVEIDENALSHFTVLSTETK
ncbi:mandelate racemase/muconate lactonizing enzyme family protein [Shewanella sp. 5_MG-2023]|uniref:mandelate racemase/muconate lactonizing enzyme family protein n=1 Tax=unclassified Shewanella TaxID=196818 RepID=UPI000C83B23A|nr:MULTISPECIES: mandelate racemase/muconate lactonizing enzyme family protein [unclassified Shewanella]MDO6641881.1 mandelate racemase/muconate lactonizing enzyme family protein [Shewanella sp. 5_MG-2023]PMH99855.1 galactonate dehydratase [Shewanella sp. 10N.286.48.A6]